MPLTPPPLSDDRDRDRLTREREMEGGDGMMYQTYPRDGTGGTARGATTTLLCCCPAGGAAIITGEGTPYSRSSNILD